MRVSILAGLCLGLGLTGVACVGDDGGTGIDTDLIGVWASCEDPSNNVFTFGEDGTFGFQDRNDDIRGTFTYDGSRVTAQGTDAAEGDQAVELEFTYYVSQDDRLVLGSMFPDGEHDGIIGTWLGYTRIAADGEPTRGGESMLELRADGTGTLTHQVDDGSADSVRDGTWREDPEDFVFSYLYEDSGTMITINLHFELVDGDVLGSPSFCRRP